MDSFYVRQDDLIKISSRNFRAGFLPGRWQMNDQRKDWIKKSRMKAVVVCDDHQGGDDELERRERESRSLALEKAYVHGKNLFIFKNKSFRRRIIEDDAQL